MAATKDTTNNRIQLNEGTRASPKTLAQIVTDINDTTWIESLYGGAVILIKRSIFSNGFWLEYSNYTHAVLENNCHLLQHTAGSGVIHRPFSRWETKNTGNFNQTHVQALRAGTFVVETAPDGSKPIIISSGGGRYDYPTTALVSGFNYYSVAYEINGVAVIGTSGPNLALKLFGAAGSIFNNMSFTGQAIFELFPNNTYDSLLSSSSNFSLINGGSSGTVSIKNWQIVNATNYGIGSYVDPGTTYNVVIDDLKNGSTGVWNGTFTYGAANAGLVTTTLRHSVSYTFANGTTPISGVKVAIVNTATVGTAQAQTVLTAGGTGGATGFAVRAQGVGNTVNLRQQQRIFARSLTHDVPHVQLTLQELTAPVQSTAQGVPSSLYGASEVVAGGVLTKLTLNYTTKTITVNQSMPSSELYDSCRWSLYQDSNLAATDFLSLSTAAARHFGDWNIAGTGTITGNIVTTGTITAPVNGTYTDSTGTRLNITEFSGRAISTYVLINGVPVGGTTVNGTFVAGWVPLATSRAITVQPTDQVRIVAGYWGSKPLLVNCLGSEVSKFTLVLETEPGVDTSISTTNRNAIANSFLTIVNGGNIEGTLNQTLAAYTPTEVVSAIAYDIVTTSYQVFAACASANTVAFYAISTGRIVFYSPSYKLRMANTTAGGATITPNATGYSIPIVTYYYNVATGVASPVTLLNASNAKLETAPWTQITASLSDSDRASIASASSASVWAAATRTLTSSAPPTAAETATAVRTSLATELARIDVTTSSVKGPTLAQIEASTVLAKEATVNTRLATSGYTAPDNTAIAAIKAKTDTLSNGPTLAQIEGSTVLAKQSGFTGLATSANVTSAQTAIVAEINANETKIDTLQTTATGIKNKTDTLVNGPTLVQIEASTVLAKEATLASKSSQSSVTALGTPMQAGEVVDANIIKVNDVFVDGTGTKADPWGPV